MRIATAWEQYEIIDASSGEKLERWGDEYFVRPDPQIIWNTKKNSPIWKSPHARYLRAASGGGKWEFYKQISKNKSVKYKGITFKIEPTGFKHMGLFPEQAVNWEFAYDKIAKSGRQINLLNLFAYTGGATLFCSKAGAKVCHVDASKGMVNWARENAKLSALEQNPIRWIVDDCEKFVLKEIRRGNKYDCIIMDPPSYGRGPNGEIWKLEDKIYPLLEMCRQILSDKPLFFILNSYTTGLSPSVMKYLLDVTVSDLFDQVTADEIGLPVTQSNSCLPCGSTAIATNIT